MWIVSAEDESAREISFCILHISAAARDERETAQKLNCLLLKLRQNNKTIANQLVKGERRSRKKAARAACLPLKLFSLIFFLLEFLLRSKKAKRKNCCGIGIGEFIEIKCVLIDFHSFESDWQTRQLIIAAKRDFNLFIFEWFRDGKFTRGFAHSFFFSPSWGFSESSYASLFALAKHQSENYFDETH